MRSCHFFLLTLLLPGMGLSTLRAGTWEEANAAFAAGNISKAQPLYKDLIDREGPTAGRLFNLGNAYAKLNNPGHAVLCYERAALLAPRDADIQANLKLIRPNEANLLAPPPWWTGPLYWLSLNEWSWLTAWGLVLVVAPILTRTLLSPRPTKSQFPPGPFIGSGLILGLIGGVALQLRHSEKALAILTAGEPVLRLSPFPTADLADVSPPPTGQRVIPGARHGDWVYISLPGSTVSGWVPGKDIAPVIPTS